MSHELSLPFWSWSTSTESESSARTLCSIHVHRLSESECLCLHILSQIFFRFMYVGTTLVFHSGLTVFIWVCVHIQYQSAITLKLDELNETDHLFPPGKTWVVLFIWMLCHAPHLMFERDPRPLPPYGQKHSKSMDCKKCSGTQQRAEIVDSASKLSDRGYAWWFEKAPPTEVLHNLQDPKFATGQSQRTCICASKGQWSFLEALGGSYTILNRLF